MANKRITDVDIVESLDSNESFFINQNNSIKQINKTNIVWPVASGGTGATSIAGIRNNLGLGNTDGPLPIANGGTGASSVETALISLGVQAQHTTATVTLIAENWVDNIQTVNVDGATETNTVLVGPFPDSYSDYAEYGVHCVGQGNGVLTFTCESVPSLNVRANVIFMK